MWWSGSRARASSFISLKWALATHHILWREDHHDEPIIIGRRAVKTDAEGFRALLCDPFRICTVLVCDKN